jgi:endonuclease/exonuclease/phosphatase (EEP) superfamily protein YafD
MIRGMFVPWIAAAMLLQAAAPPATLAPVHLVTYNVSNNHPRPARIVADIRALGAEPPVVALQEARAADVPKYRDALEKAYPGSKWKTSYQGYSFADDRDVSAIAGVALLSPFPVTFEQRTIAARDRWWLARGAIRARIVVPGAGTISVVTGHGPVGGSGSEGTFIHELASWAGEMPSPRFLGGDFNVSPTQGPFYSELREQGWEDAWEAFTGSAAGGETKRTRIDYWFWQADDSAPWHPSAVTVGAPGGSDHRPLGVDFAPGAASVTHHGWHLEDDFDAGAIGSNWVPKLFSGSRSASVPLTVRDGRLEIDLVDAGPSAQYNGIRTSAAHAFRDGEASVAIACAPSPDADAAYGMFTIGTDTAHFYRWYVAAGALHAQKNVGHGKEELGSPVPLAGRAPRIRIRHDGANGNVVFETSGAGQNSWEKVYEEPWSPAVPLDVFFELKAGTSKGQHAPGKMCWDDFAASGR